MESGIRIGTETYYDGYRFRSRLEARWALFFNELGVPFSYESQTVEEPGVISYLPDFFLDLRASRLIGLRGERSPRWHDRGMYVEVKPHQLDDEQEYKARMATRSGYPLLVLVGDPQIGPHRIIFPEACSQSKLRYSWALCPDCLEPGLVYPWTTLVKTYLQLNCCDHPGLRNREGRKKRLLNASHAVSYMAMKARHSHFEIWAKD